MQLELKRTLVSQPSGAIPRDIQQATFHRCHCCCIPIFYRPNSKVELMFDFPIICTKCGWALVGWMAREGGGAGNKLHGEGVSSAPRREIEKHYCCQSSSPPSTSSSRPRQAAPETPEPQVSRESYLERVRVLHPSKLQQRVRPLSLNQSLMADRCL